MFVITLRFADKTKAPQLMEDHNAWIQRGIAEGIFLLVGSLQPNAGGAIIAHNVAREDIEVRVKGDPFVSEGVVTAEILEITPGYTEERLAFLKG